MMGAFLSQKVSSYSGLEPSSKSHESLHGVKEYLYEYSDHMNMDLFCFGSEVYFDSLFSKDSYDFIFTSPPYYNTERYSNELTQSWVRFSTYEKWLDGFMLMTCENIRAVCHFDSIVAWNVANVKNVAPRLVEDVDSIMRGLGFKFIEKLDYLMSGRPQNSRYKSEPILFYRY